MNSPPTPLHSEPRGDLPEIPKELGDAINVDPEFDDEIVDEPDEPDEVPGPKLMDTFTIAIDLAVDHAKLQFADHALLLTSGQESQFIMDMDARVLAVQRRFIKQQAGEVTCTLFDLIGDLDPILDTLWKSITNRNRLFCQLDYLMKILGDYEDYLTHWREPFGEINPSKSLPSQLYLHLVKYFVFLQRLDVILSVLTDGYQAQRSKQKLRGTELVRLMPIITRIRVIVAAQLGSVVDKLEFSVDDTYVTLRQVLDIELTRVFEGMLDRANG